MLQILVMDLLGNNLGMYFDFQLQVSCVLTVPLVPWFRTVTAALLINGNHSQRVAHTGTHLTLTTPSQHLKEPHSLGNRNCPYEP